MLGVSPSAYEEACGILGAENAAAVMACILERAGHINSAGGYLSDFTRKAERGLLPTFGYEALKTAVPRDLFAVSVC
nr:replication initiation protein RepC [Ensifer adhaerens]